VSTSKLTGLEIIGDVIREHNDLGEVAVPRQLETTHQRRHRKMIVETSQGVFLAKTYRNDPASVDSLYFQHRLSGFLAENGLPVARIQGTRDGRTFVVQDTWCLELQQFVFGHSMTVNEATLRVSGSALGRLHQVCQGMPVPPRDARKWRFSEVPQETFQKFYEMALKERADQKIQGHCNNIVLFLQQAKEVLNIDKRYAFEMGLIHGDWHGGNLLFDGDTLKAIIDLEFAGDGCYLEDISYAVSNLCIRTTTSPEKMAFRTETLLGAYELHRALSYAERVALYYAVGVKHVTTVCYQTPQQGGRVAGYSPAQWMGILDAQTRWLGEQSRRARWGE
jgi:Ser/Thr protein kinase RdoA (MazF antagonist)